MIGLGLSLSCVAQGGSPPPPSFTDFNQINTEFWYSLNPNAALVSTLSFGSGVSQITGVNSGTARNATQATGALQPSYNATGLNGFPCVLGDLASDRELNLPNVNITGCAILAVVQLPATYTNPFESFGVGNNQTGNSADLFAGKNDNAISGLSQEGVAIRDISSGCLSTATGTGVAFWFAQEGAWRTSWNGGTETTSSEMSGTPTFETWLLTWGSSSIKLGEFVVLSAIDSTPGNIAQGITILKSRWGIA